MLNLSNITALLLLVFIIFAWLDFRCNTKPSDPANVTVTVQKDSVMLPPIYVNVPPANYSTTYNPVPQQIDSFAIAKAYFATHVYNDTVRLDSVDVYVNEVVSQNQIQSRMIGVKLNFPIATTTTVTEIHTSKVRNKLLLGASLQYTGEALSVVPMLGVMDKRSRMLTVGYDPLMGSYQVGAMWTVKIKK